MANGLRGGQRRLNLSTVDPADIRESTGAFRLQVIHQTWYSSRRGLSLGTRVSANTASNDQRGGTIYRRPFCPLLKSRSELSKNNRTVTRAHSPWLSRTILTLVCHYLGHERGAA